MKLTYAPNEHSLLRTLFLFVLIFSLTSCASDKDDVMEEDPEMAVEDPAEPDNPETPSEDPQAGCDDVSKYIFNEKDGLVKVEFENALFIKEEWKQEASEQNFSGEGYMVWTGDENLGNPGVGATSFKIKINNPGTYQFLWKSAVTIGSNGTEHNDTWLRFDDADDFYGKKGESIVYPKGRNKTPNPEGATKDGWFKIYRSGNDLGFKWQARTFDNNAHDIFVEFKEPGVYTMEISARSKGHAIDAFVLFTEAFGKNNAMDAETFSEITCN
ncbi:hypothetical protein HX109_06355 [Galbibacter sp. BG1]|uniref:hypothetical protein n=1 Tax=Galbibacter sp. BG1 TaxID=1170699 RepID=UPI0015B92A0F|nr:hypothetical protein [Galbibacter sp. BG1]QLE01204.1 hypothetical protein HX109_06355 [Galbibacter sp. BG1]